MAATEHVADNVTATITCHPEVTDGLKNALRAALESTPGVEHVQIIIEPIMQYKPEGASA